MSDNDKEAFSHVKKVVLLVWIIFGFPKDVHGMVMVKEKIISILNKISFVDLEPWWPESKK